MPQEPTDAELAALFPGLSRKGRRTMWLIFQGVVIADAFDRLPPEEAKKLAATAAPSYNALLGLDES